MRGWLLTGIAAVCLANTAHALDPAKDLSQYVHDSWDAHNGFLGGAVFAVCQSKDGYLWIGTERGLVRFDGLDFTLIQRPILGSPPLGAVRGLVADSEGNLWIRLEGPHLLRYRDGKFEDAMARFGLQELAFTSMSVDNKGELILWGPKNQILRFSDGEFRYFAPSNGIPGIAISAAQTKDGKIWLGTRDMGLLQVDPRRIVNVSSRLAVTSVNALLPASDGGLWIGTDAGLHFWDGRDLVKLAPSLSIPQLQILTLIKDRNGNVWVGTDHGLIRITPALSVSTELLKPKSNAAVNAIYEDRDGDIWVGGPHGIERFRDGMFTGYSIRQGLPSDNSGPLYIDSQRRTWFAPASGGLYWIKDGHIGRVTNDGLASDVIYSINGGADEIWVGRQHGGLTVLKSTPRGFVARTYTLADGLAQNSVYSVLRSRDGTVWAGTVSGGISRLSHGTFTNYSVMNGLASNTVFSILEGYNGTMWFTTPSGLESYASGHWTNFAAPGSLLSANMRSLFEDSNHVLWIATSGGLAFFHSGRVEVPKSLTNSLREDILGITEDTQGSLWIVTSDHVLQVDRDRLLAGSLRDSDVQSFGTEDGLPGVEGVSRDRSVLSDPDGRIWISLASGLATADPTIAARYAAPVTVRIESISDGGKAFNLSKSASLPAGTHSVTFNYSDSNLSDPQRIRFRYTLDGSDQSWSHEVASRQVVFTNLGPGLHRFGIVASNGVGLWNGPETTVDFLVKPTFWQTWWFRVGCVTVCCLIVIALYRLRMSQITRRLNVRFQDRLAERTRIAQELHDTLLQGVLSASMQLDVVEDQTPNDSPTKPLLRRVLQLMGQVTEEGRSALRGLRIPASHSLSLETALSRVCEEFTPNETTAYRVVAQGDAQPLNPIIRDEVYRIGREAVVNAFLHAQANNIQVEVEYANRFFRLLVSDDGCGIDSHVLETGREGHWGLPGMRERSESIGAHLKLRSRIGGGTEVELTIPAAVAFEGQLHERLSLWRPWLTRERFDTHGTGFKKREKR